MHQKCIRNVSEIYPKLKLLSLDLSHSNTIKIKTSIHISSYITYIYPKFNLLSLYLTYSNTVKIPNASQIYWLMKRASNWTKSPLYLGKKVFFGGFYPFPSKSENDTKFEKNWWDGLSPPGQLGFHLSQLFS